MYTLKPVISIDILGLPRGFSRVAMGGVLIKKSG